MTPNYTKPPNLRHFLSTFIEAQLLQRHRVVGGHKDFKFDTERICSGSRDLFKFWKISDNISETVQNREIDRIAAVEY